MHLAKERDPTFFENRSGLSIVSNIYGDMGGCQDREINKPEYPAEICQGKKVTGSNEELNSRYAKHLVGNPYMGVH